MRSACLLGALIGVLSLSAWVGGQTPQAPPPATGTGFIAGQVVDTTGQPIPEATVRLIGRGRTAGPGGRAGATPSPPPVAADSQGRYFFASLAPGTYSVVATKRGYGYPRSGASQQIDLGAHERLLDVRIRLEQVASLSGVLRDEVGDPVVGTDVIAFSRFIFNGQPSVQQRGRSRSDDRGAYRIANLASGDYFVCACTRDPVPFDGLLLTTLASEPVQLMTVAARALTEGSDVAVLDDTLRTYAPALYQNSATLTGATRVTLAPGEDRSAIDFNLPLVHATRVSGTIVGAPGPIPSSLVRLLPARDADEGIELFWLQPLLVQPDGRFDFAGVPPGQYQLAVTYLGTSGRGAGPTGAALAFLGARGTTPPQVPIRVSGGPANGQDALWATVPVTVGDEGVNGLVVTLNPARKMTGRIEYVGAAPQPPPRSFAFVLESLGPSRSTGPVGRVAADRTFVVSGALPGKYGFILSGAPGYPTLRSITADGVDVTDLPLEVGDRDIEVVATFVDTPMASIAVDLNRAGPTSGNADPAWAILFPADHKYWANPAAARRRYRSVALTTKGTATLADLPAGDYYLVVAEERDAFAWQEQVELEALARRAERVTLADGEHKTVTVRR
jgi:Carboxypeptidase regulatory-like domain